MISKRSLSALAKAFGRRVVGGEQERYGSRYLVTLHARGWNQTIDQEIRELVAAIKRLPRTVRTLWNGSQSREFNIGLPAGLAPRLREFKLSPRTIALVAAVRATIVITVYAPEVPSRGAKPRKKAR